MKIKHIKTPVTVGRRMLFERDRLGLPVPLAEVYGDDNLEKTHEIATALNERDDLLTQRDALVGACERLMDAYNATDDMVRVIDPEAAPVDIADLIDYQGLVEATELADAALALVRGEEEKQP